MKNDECPRRASRVPVGRFFFCRFFSLLRKLIEKNHSKSSLLRNEPQYPTVRGICSTQRQRGKPRPRLTMRGWGGWVFLRKGQVFILRNEK
jgi:hypothetical protein